MDLEKIDYKSDFIDSSIVINDKKAIGNASNQLVISE